jgi:hypothetical protein
MSGGSRRVYFGSQRVARAVVSWLAICRFTSLVLLLVMLEREPDGLSSEASLAGAEEAVVKVRREVAGKVNGDLSYRIVAPQF